MNDDGKAQNDTPLQDEQVHELIEQLETIDRHITPEHVAKRFRELLHGMGDDRLPAPAAAGKDRLAEDVITPLHAPQAQGASSNDVPRPNRRPGRKLKGSVPTIIRETPDKPDPDHVLTWRQRKVLQVIRESVQKRGYPPSMREIGTPSA